MLNSEPYLSVIVVLPSSRRGQSIERCQSKRFTHMLNSRTRKSHTQMRKQSEVMKAVLASHGSGAKTSEEYGLSSLGHGAEVIGGFLCAAEPKASCINCPSKTLTRFEWFVPKDLKDL